MTPVRLETVALWSRVLSVWIQNAVKANVTNKGLTSIRAKIWAYTWVSEKFGRSNAKTQKTGNSYTFFIKKRGFIPGGAEKGGGGIRAHIRTMSYIGSYPPSPHPENVVRGHQKLCKRSPYNASLKLSKTYVKYWYFNMILNAKNCLDRCGISLWSSEKLKLFWFWSVLNVIFRILKIQYLT